MSVKYYGKMWIATKDDLEDVILREKVVQNLIPTRDSIIAHRIFASLYSRYVILCNNLGEIYDQTCQVQKRKVVEEILISATNRMFELEKEIKSVEMSEFIYLDQTIIEQKFIPENIQLLKPFYFPYKRDQNIQDLINDIRPPKILTEEEILQKKREFEMKPKYLQMMKELTPEEIEMNRIKKHFVDAINLIKIHEKARQSRVFLTNIRMQPEIYMPQPPKPLLAEKYDFYHKKDQAMLIRVARTVFPTKIDEQKYSMTEENPSTEIISNDKLLEIARLFKRKENSVRIIQKAWRKFIKKKIIAAKEHKKLLIYGMIDERKWDFSMYQQIEKSRRLHSDKKSLFDKAFIQACTDEKAKILKLHSPWIMEDISDSIRAWFKEWYKEVLTFDRYPQEFEGGTILVMRGLTPTIPEYVELVRKQAEDKLKSADQKKKEAQEKIEKKKKEKELLKKEKAMKKKLLEDKKKMAEKMGKQWEFNEEFITNNFINLEKTLEEYERDWYFIDELKNLHELPYMDWVSLDAYAEVHQELRQIVDEFMRIEHELLRMSLAFDESKAYKPQKMKKEKKKKGKRLGKIENDLIDGQSIESVYDKLVDIGVIRKYPRRKLEDFIGDINYGAFELRNIHEKNPIHFMGEVKSIIRSQIVGMGPLELNKAKSICIAGPRQSGKKFLMEAICSETDAVLFDLSAKQMLHFTDMKYFMMMITKMTRILQPSVLFIDGAHKPFYKKIPKEEKELEPKKIGAILPKIVKAIKPNEKVMLIGTTNEPWNSQMPKMKKCYEKIVFIPKSDYGSVLLTWRTACLNKLGVSRTIDFSALAKITEGYPTGQILDTVDRVVDLRRRMKFSRNPLTTRELLEGLLLGPLPNFPITDDEFLKFVNWYNKIDPLAKIRADKEAEKLNESTKKKK